MYFESTLTEKNGEREYSHHYLIDADDFDNALEKIRCYASNWYGEADAHDIVFFDVLYNEEENNWSFFGGEITITVSDPVKTTLEKYFERIQETYLIK